MTDKVKNKIIQYLNSEYRDLEQFETEEWPNYIFFVKDGEVVFDYKTKNGYVGISYYKIWSFLQSFFGLEYEEIQVLIKEWVEEHFKLRVATSYCVKPRLLPKVEEHFKLRVATSDAIQTAFFELEDEHFKLETNDR